MKKIISIILCASVILYGFCSFAQEEVIEEKVPPFSDITSAWAKDEIIRLCEEGIINGVEPGKFMPDKQITRAEFMTMIFRVLSLSPIDYEGIYSDVSEDMWYADMLQTMYKLNLIDKEVFKGEFNGNSAITREEMAMLLCKGYYLYSDEANFKEINYNDADGFSGWSKVYIEAVSNLNIMQGRENGNFDAHEKATRQEAAAVIVRLMKAFSDAGFDTGRMPWKQAPIIYKLSDEIKPGEAFGVYGAGLSKESKIYIEAAETAGDLPSEYSTEVEVTLYSEEESYVLAILPENAVGKVYKLWTENSYGISNAMYLNNPRAFWVGQSDISFEGQILPLIGVGFMLDRIGGKTDTKIKLTVNGNDYEAKITELLPYCIKFEIPHGIETGEYTVSVTNNGGITWETLDNEQTLSIVTPGADPYNLGVGWAKNYVYDYRVNVKDYGAKGDGIADDTQAIAKALAVLEENGGGILYLPIGTYRASEIQIPAKVIFEGEDRENSRIAYCGTDNSAQFIRSNAASTMVGYQGFTNLTITKSPEVTSYQYPDALMWAGHQFEEEYVHQLMARHFEGFFMKNMNIDFPIEASDGGRGLTYAIIRKYFLVDDVIGKGYRTGWCPVTGDYYTMTNTNQKAVTTSNEHTGRYGIFENNIINMQSQIYKEDGTQHYAQGIFLRSDAYLHNNKILNTGTLGTANNDGEIFCTENPNGGTVRYAGDVVSATLNTVSLKYQKDASGEPFAYKFNGCSNSELDPRFGFYYAMIVEGRGIGQIRHVTGNVRDSEIATLTLKDPWDIVPDKTSKILMTTLTKETVYYDNYAENCEKGFWFYGGTYDSIAEKCNGVNVEGILSRNFDVESTNRRTYGYFNVFKDNSLVGTSRLGGVSYISIDVSNEVKQASFGISLYGSEIKRNYMEGALYEAKPEKNTEGLYQNGIFLGYTSPWIAPTQNFVHASIIEDNSLVNMNNGICVGSLKNSKQTGMGVSGVIIKGNNFTNVKNHISTYGIVENLIQIGQ